MVLILACNLLIFTKNAIMRKKNLTYINLINVRCYTYDFC